MGQRAPGRAEREGISLLEFVDLVPDEDAARRWFEALVWPKGRHCPRCGGTETVEASATSGLPYRCPDCRRTFSVRTGTALAESKIPLRKWALAIYLMVTSLKGVSSMKLHRDLGVTQKTAWFMTQRIREAWVDGEAPPFDGPVEFDETHFGGKRKWMRTACWADQVRRESFREQAEGRCRCHASRAGPTRRRGAAAVRDYGRDCRPTRLPFEEAAQYASTGRVRQLAQRPGLDLADALARHRELPADLFERAIASRADAEAHAQHALLPRLQGAEQPRHGVAQVGADGSIEGLHRVLIGRGERIRFLSGCFWIVESGCRNNF